MIEIQLDELDLELEVAELPEHQFTVEETSNIELQGPIDFATLDPEPTEWGFIDLDLLGFPYHGLSAYDIALKNGFVGTEAEWLASLKGEPGTLSPEGNDAVNRAESAADRAGGSADAAAGHEFQAYTYAGQAGIHAASSLSAYTQAVAARDETNQIASAMTLIHQESEALIIGARELATSTIQERVLAETARSDAELSRTRAAQSETNAAGSAASASDNAVMAVEARNQADDRAAAALLSESEARSSADDARTDAEAANQSRLIASAARDAAQVTAQGVVIEVQKAEGHATDAEAWAAASREERIAAEAARNQSEQHAQASLTSAQTADARANDAETFAGAAQQERINAETAAGQANTYRQAAAQSVVDANGHRVAAENAQGVAVQQAGFAGQSATAASGYRDQAQAYADTAGQVYGVLAGRVTTVEGRIGDVEGSIETVEEVAIDARNRVNLKWGLTLNANGKISGMSNTNDGVISVFAIQSDKFQVSDGNASITPFTYSGGVLEAGSLRLKGSIDINDKFKVDANGNLTMKSANSGARREMTNQLDLIYDAAGTLRIRFGVW